MWLVKKGNNYDFSITFKFHNRLSFTIIILRSTLYRSSRPEVFCKKGVYRNFTKLRLQTLAQVFSCEFCEISKNTFFNRTPLLAASDFMINLSYIACAVYFGVHTKIRYQNFLSAYYFSAKICLLKVNNRNTRKSCEICSKLTMKTPECRHWSRSGVFIVNSEHISYFFLVFLLLTLNK